MHAHNKKLEEEVQLFLTKCKMEINWHIKKDDKRLEKMIIEVVKFFEIIDSNFPL